MNLEILNILVQKFIYLLHISDLSQHFFEYLLWGSYHKIKFNMNDETLNSIIPLTQHYYFNTDIIILPLSFLLDHVYQPVGCSVSAQFVSFYLLSPALQNLICITFKSLPLSILHQLIHHFCLQLPFFWQK